MQEQMRANLAMRLALPAVVVALATMLCLMVGVDSAYAGGGRDIADFKGNVTEVFWDKGYTFVYSDLKARKKISAVKSSNKKVATASLMKVKGGRTYIKITMKKPGKTKITYKLAGKKKTTTLKLVKWKKPVKSFKIGSTNYASKFNKFSTYLGVSDLGGKTLKIKPARGWKVAKIQYLVGEGKLKKIKNGKKLPSGTTDVNVTLMNKKTKAVEYLGVYYYSDTLSAA